MSAIHIVKNPLMPTDRSSHSVADGTRIIDWLQEHHPDGWGMPIRVWVNQEEIELENMDRVLGKNDVCAIVVTPGFTGWEVYAIQAIVSIAVGLLINILFPPPKMKNGRPEGSPVYDIGVTRNTERLGEPVSVVYGQIRTVPDFASKPYQFFAMSGNFHQLTDELMCLGVGEFDEITLDDILIGDTPASSMPSGSIIFQQFHDAPTVGKINDHRHSFGQIEKQLWRDEFGGRDEHKFLEHCMTVPEVTDWEFNDDIVTAIQTYTVDVTITFGPPGFIQITNLSPTNTIDIRAGQEITLGNAGPNDGKYWVQFVTAAGAPDADGAATQLNILVSAVTPTVQNGSYPSATIQATAESSGAVAGPYVATPVGSLVARIWIDLASPQGVYTVRNSNGNYDYPSDPNKIPTVKITVTEIDDGNQVVPGGVVAERTYSYSHNRPNAVRHTTYVDGNNITSGHAIDDFAGRRYQVKMEAVHNFSFKSNLQNKVTWVGLRAQIYHPQGTEAYKGVTLLAIRLRGTNGISAQTQDQISVHARRKFPLIDGTTEISSNPADAFHDIYTNKVYGLGRPNTEIDMTQLRSMRDCWNLPNVDAPQFNGVFQNRITIWEGLEMAIGLAVARPAIEAGQLTIVADKKKSLLSYVFNESNTVVDSVTAQFTIDAQGEVDAIELQYRDPETLNPAFVSFPELNSAGNTPENPNKLELFGCTDKSYAEKYARLMWNRRIYQRRTITFDTEMDGMLPSIGDRFLFSTSMLNWGTSGRVLDVKNPTSANPILVIDKNLDWAELYTSVYVTDDHGVVSAPVTFTKGSADNELTLASALSIDLDMSLDVDPPRYAIVANHSAGRNMVITEIQHQGGTLFRITAVNYEVGLTTSEQHPLFEGTPIHLVTDSAGAAL